MILYFFQVRGLSFGYRSNTLLASGGSHGRVLVWDLNDLSPDFFGKMSSLNVNVNTRAVYWR